MPNVINPNNPSSLLEWTDEINEIDNQFGFIRSQDFFTIKPTSQTSVLFDKIANDIRLIPQSNPRAKGHTVGKDRNVETFAMALRYYNDQDYIDVQDIQDQRRPGEVDISETLASVRADKLEDLKYGHDLTDEYLRFSAMKGDLPTGAVVGQTDMYGLFGLDKAADYTVDLELANATVDLDGKLSAVKRLVASGVKTGSAVGGVDFYMSYEMFDAMIANPKFREVYNYYQNSGKQALRDDLANYYDWGVTDFFEHRGVRFLAYNPDFKDENGDVVNVIAAGEGFAIPRNARGMFRGYQGPANKLSLAGRAGAEMFAFERTSSDDESHTLEIQARKLYWATKPAGIIQLT